MKIGRHQHRKRSLSVAAAAILALALTACTGRGGGQLPPDLPPAEVSFTGPATFGFDFSCEDSGGLNPPTGQLRIELAYTDHGSNPIGSSFTIHGIVDTIDPVLESMICIGQNPPPEPAPPNELTFLGRYWLVSSAPAGFPSTCPARRAETTSLCRFEVIVRDNDVDHAPSTGDYFSINLTAVTTPCTWDPPDPPDPACSDLAAGFYTRAGVLSGGNLTVD